MEDIGNMNGLKIPCIGCDQCQRVCPKQIGISGSFEAMNHLTKTGNLEEARGIEKALVLDKGLNKAGQCIVCGRCEKVCPVRIKIRDRLLDISKIL